MATAVSSSSRIRTLSFFDSLSPTQQMDVREMFEAFDEDKSGTISAGELRDAMIALDYKMSEEEFARTFTQLDRDASGEVSIEEFAKFIHSANEDKSGVQRAPKVEIMGLYSQFCDKRTGKISFRSLKKAAERLGEVFNEDELFEIFMAADVNATGEIDEQEFLAMVKQTGFI
eukprot:TRINITY_DN4288_c0_g1_i1.p1 TRINITY_DN4288_c0_g1~~TRINITY_DN4288_c0_g1_i1.p1  ORF type:complete len:173 (-),score=44.96 TRINITY_DN4288_c0_g1_i1:773-1291(-)